MFWWILIGVSVFFTILGIILAIIYQHCCVDEWIGTMAGFFVGLFGIVLILSGIIVPIQKVCCDKEIEVFKQQKYYIEEVVPTLPETDNYAITAKRIELNEWLYNAQYAVEHYGFFTLYSDEVLELEEIK